MTLLVVAPCFVIIGHCLTSRTAMRLLSTAIYFNLRATFGELAGLQNRADGRAIETSRFATSLVCVELSASNGKDSSCVKVLLHRHSEEILFPDLWGARISDDPGLPDRRPIPGTCRRKMPVHCREFQISRSPPG
jgi:hypothetical protein